MSNEVIVASSEPSPIAQNWVRRGLGLLVAGLVVYAYFIQPVEHELTTYSWLVGHWQTVSHYSHGPLVPLIAVVLAWLKRRELMAATISPLRWGVGVVAMAMVIYYTGVKGGQPRLAVLSFVVLLYGLVAALAGREMLRLLFFPVCFLLLMIPLNFLDEQIGVPLQHIMAAASSAILNVIGIDAQKDGTRIFSSVFAFDVAAPCSGIRSLMALATVTAAFAYLTQRVQWKRWALFLSAMPLAVLGNLARVVSIALVAQVYGQKVAQRVYHDWSGFIVFGVALAVMVAISQLLNYPYHKLLEQRAPASSQPARNVL